MQRLLEIIFGLDHGFLGREGDFSVTFAPRWPAQQWLGAATWNLLLAAAALALVIYVYRREGRSRFARITLGVMRGLLLAFVIALLNRPVLTLTQSRSEPSVLAILMDDSISMQVRDGRTGADGQAASRLQAVLDLLSGDNEKLVRDLSAQHIVKFYRFNRDAQAIATVTQNSVTPAGSDGPSTQPSNGIAPLLASLRPTGQSTQVLASLRTVLQELQGQRLAGVVVLTDGRSTPTESLADGVAAIKDFNARIYPVAVGSDKAPQNILVESMNLQDAAFVKDIVNVRANLRGVGYSPGHQVTLILKNKKTGQPLLKADGRPAQELVTLAGETAQEVELNFKPSEVGVLDVTVEAIKQNGEVDDEDNTRTAQVAVLDAKIAVLYCEGSPRWDYRYLKNELIRDTTVDVSCLLFSADPGFAQEGDKPITRFPESMTEMLAYDVVLFGDVDPRQFTDAQLQLVNDFVSKKGGGFGMIAGPRFAPWDFRATPIEPILPVTITRVPDDRTSVPTPVGFRPVLTKEGQNSTIFRFFEKKQDTEKFLREGMELLFWYGQGFNAKPGVGEVYAEHPTDTSPDGRKAPLLVLGRYGAGRTLFSAIDDSWRWRRYTGESIFSTYWIQQLRYLARAKKLGQRRLTLTSLRPAYELGEKVEVSLRVLDPDLLQQLPEQVGVLLENADGQPVRRDMMQRREGEPDLYVVAWMADTAGRFVLRLPPVAGGTEAMELPIEVNVPRLELAEPQVNRDLLSRLVATAGSGEQGGPDVNKLWLNAQTDLQTVRAELTRIPSAAVTVPVYANQPLWNAPLAMILFVGLLTIEWVLRKMYGML